MQVAEVNGVKICYESLGPEEAPAVMLIMGLSAQLISWPDQFVKAFLKAGYRVIRFDNRDSGLSSQMDDGQNWAVTKTTFISSYLGRAVPAPYRLADMAKDSVALLDELGIETAHVIGVSMGGMIAQHVAARYPERVRSLVSFMSTSGSRRVPLGKMKCILRLGRKAKTNKPDDIISHLHEGWKLYASPGFPREPGELLDWAKKLYQRSYVPEGATRQFRAVLNDGSRVACLKRITAPTLAIHGAADPLVHPAGSKDIARHVPDAKLVLIDGLGHEIPPKSIPVVTEHMLDHLKTAEGLAENDR